MVHLKVNNCNDVLFIITSPIVNTKDNQCNKSILYWNKIMILNAMKYSDHLLPSSAQSSSAEMVLLSSSDHPTNHPPGESKQIYCKTNLLQSKFTAK